MGEDDDKDWGAEEAAAWFDPAPEMEAHLAIYQQVLVAYGFHCALTGQKFDSISDGVHTALQVVAIRPRALGGPLHVSNYLCLADMAARAFARGHWLVDDDYGVVADRRVMVPELARALRVEGRLLLPEDRLYHPDRTQLAWHRTRILNGA
ncbi:hypothetical protein PSQ19_10260 [Devosia algicola]|uniref:DUF4262 domain-containing protein n=1 Tax=Devosia algicola TaxID=3026418 RepID=A0ABY7YJH5_9HYPH|nr:hypothetical protein [Devosia algicola]WDR01239.1 hypothetical protein PSQ19_10260 [Devosia algicola]